jgi:pimeloyl-ACP methyl ester carboxylesterase
MAQPPPKLKILMLHGYTQSAPLFSTKTNVLQKALLKALPTAPKPGFLPEYPGGVETVYLNAPIRLVAADLPGGKPENLDSDGALEQYGWWVRDTSHQTWTGIDKTWELLATTLKEQGPFAGVIGFSQGAALAVTLTSFLEPGRIEAFKAKQDGHDFPAAFLNEDGALIHPPLRFCVSYAGFPLTDPRWYAVYEPTVQTPVLSVVGSVDTIIEEKVSEMLHSLLGPDIQQRIIQHPGGHFVPSGKMEVAGLVGFLRSVLMPKKVEIDSNI